VATITGLTAERMLQIEASSVVSGVINEFDHLILSQHDGTPIDAGPLPGTPDASTTVKGRVELATEAETIAFTDTTRAITPAGIASTYYGLKGRLDVIEAKPLVTMASLLPASFSQNTLFTSYPQGFSRLYYTTTNSSAWGFSGKTGEVLTYVEGSDFAKQTWTRHVGGSTNFTEVWIRTANAVNGWSKWLAIADDTGWQNIPYASGYSALPLGEVIQYRVKDSIVFYRGGASGSYPNDTYSLVAAAGAIPSAYRPTLNVRGGAMGTGCRPGGFEIGTDGSIKLGSGGLSVQPAWLAFNASYPIN
jgi:hypothetical protein